MTFLSYAQNFEDVVLWRALKHIEAGFYIDIGANDPTLHSVTRAFYERGWAGVNVEPVNQFFSRLQSERPRDVNLQCAVGARKGEITFYSIPDTGLSTMDREVAHTHFEAGWRYTESNVPMRTLADICAEHVADKAIHFLKIDVEGAEADVVAGMDWKRWRPWIVVLESTRPLSQESSGVEWEHTLLAAGYQFAYFDGLNRFYVDDSHLDLADALKTPPNVFDEFMVDWMVDVGRREARVAELPAARLAAVQAALHEKEGEFDALQALYARQGEELNVARNHAGRLSAELRTVRQELQAVARLTAEISALRNSTSWRLTAPLRAVLDTLRGGRRVHAPQDVHRASEAAMSSPRAPALSARVRQQGISIAKRAVKRIGRAAIGHLRSHPTHKNLLLGLLARLPNLERAARRLYGSLSAPAGGYFPTVPTGNEGNWQDMPATNRWIASRLLRKSATSSTEDMEK
ncbi:hypothetical protein LMG23992_02992 [Cupriavidus laharis]|uniref:Methyltransferase FkbM domain-containing protein n=1 Tax=Cupriavidus laharis TaxID=151654 RepID=A0ABM8X6Q3_9BURK|nr:FkbM family methyltransferase [Cupriavidus laharis]CAG9175572.1 hypothetical protein LMG23992_02992 [Cupriavidus laharis]